MAFAVLALIAAAIGWQRLRASQWNAERTAILRDAAEAGRMMDCSQYLNATGGRADHATSDLMREMSEAQIAACKATLSK